MAWLTQNGGTIVVCALLGAAILAAVIAVMKGKTGGCGGGCSGCAYHDTCHKKQKK